MTILINLTSKLNLFAAPEYITYVFLDNISLITTLGNKYINYSIKEIVNAGKTLVIYCSAECSSQLAGFFTLQTSCEETRRWYCSIASNVKLAPNIRLDLIRNNVLILCKCKSMEVLKFLLCV